MGKNSKIQWTHHTFNPWVGCFKVSPGCKNCYAENQMTSKHRWENTWGPPELTQRIKTSEANWKQPIRWNNEAKRLGIRYRVFCASLADIFEDNKQVEEWRKELFALIHKTPYLDWLLLTKRPENIRNMLGKAPDNVWLGTSVENQETADSRISALVVNQSKVHFLSVEPMLESIDLELLGRNYGIDYPDWSERVDWVIVGGESGKHQRPFEWDWARYVLYQCREASIPFFMKQGSGLSQGSMPRIPDDLLIREFPEPNTDNPHYAQVRLL